MEQEQIRKSYDSDNRERFCSTDPLGGFIAEVENGAGLQTLDVAAMRYEKLCNEAQLDIDKEVPPPPVAIYIGDSPACTFGNFSASIGKPKGKKTFNVSAMTAAAMTNSTILNYRGNMPSDQNGILYFDTEQSKYHAFRVFKRIARLTHKSNQEINERIKYFALRKYSVEDRIGMIDHKIRNTRAVGLVVIDGIRDLMLDINSPREATLIVNYLMKWTEEYNLHIHTIIHQNKSDENARGHIGTEINTSLKPFSVSRRTRTMMPSVPLRRSISEISLSLRLPFGLTPRLYPNSSRTMCRHQKPKATRHGTRTMT